LLARLRNALRSLTHAQWPAAGVLVIGVVQLVNFIAVTWLLHDQPWLPEALGGAVGSPADMWVKLVTKFFGYSGMSAAAFVALQMAIPLWLIVSAVFAMKGLRWPLIVTLFVLTATWVFAIARLSDSDSRSITSLIAWPLVYGTSGLMVLSEDRNERKARQRAR
jgi:hypothetical protein